MCTHTSSTDRYSVSYEGTGVLCSDLTLDVLSWIASIAALRDVQASSSNPSGGRGGAFVSLMVSLRTGAAPFGPREPVPSPPRGAMAASGLVARRRNPTGPKGAPNARTTRPASSPALSALWSASGTRSALKLDATTRLPASLCRPLRKFDPRFDRSETSATSVRGTTPPQLAHAPARIGARRRRDEPTRERGAPPTRRRGERQSRRPMQVRATRSPRGPANPILPRAASRNVDYGNVRD